MFIPPSQPVIPNPPASLEPTTRGYLSVLVKSLLQILSTRLDVRSPVSSVLLASPNGSVYTVTVTDAGVLQATKVQDGT